MLFSAIFCQFIYLYNIFQDETLKIESISLLTDRRNRWRDSAYVYLSFADNAFLLSPPGKYILPHVCIMEPRIRQNRNLEATPNAVFHYARGGARSECRG